MPAMFLLISDHKEDHQWCRLVREALAPWGSLEIQGKKAALGSPSQSCYDLIIVDASATIEMLYLIRSLQDRQPGVSIVVFSAFPTWQQAREAFRAGAKDYVRKTINKRMLCTYFARMLTGTLPQ